MNLVQMLTGIGSESSNCCVKVCKYMKTAVPYALCGKLSQERKDALAAADTTTAAGKFAHTRLKMVRFIAQTAFPMAPRLTFC